MENNEVKKICCFALFGQSETSVGIINGDRLEPKLVACVLCGTSAGPLRQV